MLVAYTPLLFPRAPPRCDDRATDPQARDPVQFQVAPGGGETGRATIVEAGRCLWIRVTSARPLWRWSARN